MSFKTVWKEISRLLPGLAIVLTAVGLWQAYSFQAQNAAQSLAFQRENTAKSMYHDYLKLAIDNAELAGGQTEFTAKYEWFVAYFLGASEEILNYAPNDEGWRDTITMQLKYHRAYLCKSKEFDKSIYSAALRELIDSVCAGKKT